MVANRHATETAPGVRIAPPNIAHQNASADAKKQTCCNTCNSPLARAARKSGGRCQIHSAIACTLVAETGALIHRAICRTDGERLNPAIACRAPRQHEQRRGNHHQHLVLDHVRCKRSAGERVDRRQECRGECRDTESEARDIDDANATTHPGLAPEARDTTRVEEGARQEKTREHGIEIHMQAGAGPRDVRHAVGCDERGQRAADQ